MVLQRSYYFLAGENPYFFAVDRRKGLIVLVSSGRATEEPLLTRGLLPRCALSLGVLTGSHHY
jgi:hypothetical protein